MVDYDKVIQRVENMIYKTSGCTHQEGKKVLEACLRRNIMKGASIVRVK
jgi:hypothetical protein